MITFNFWSRFFSDTFKLSIVFVNQDILYHKWFQEKLKTIFAIILPFTTAEITFKALTALFFHGLNVDISCDDVKRLKCSWTSWR